MGQGGYQCRLAPCELDTCTGMLLFLLSCPLSSTAKVTVLSALSVCGLSIHPPLLLPRAQPSLSVCFELDLTSLQQMSDGRAWYLCFLFFPCLRSNPPFSLRAVAVSLTMNMLHSAWGGSNSILDFLLGQRCTPVHTDMYNRLKSRGPPSPLKPHPFLARPECPVPSRFAWTGLLAACCFAFSSAILSLSYQRAARRPMQVPVGPSNASTPNRTPVCSRAALDQYVGRRSWAKQL